MTILAACGLRREAKIAARAGLLAIAAGGDGERLAAELSRAAESARGILSFGIAGGLAPGLPAGTCILATEIVSGGERLPTDAAWRARMKERLPEALPAPIAGASVLLSTPAAKAALYGQCRAAAVDMESHIAARIARARNIPFVALRAIADPAEAALPLCALVALSPEGAIRPAAVLGSILSHPSQMPALLVTLRQSRAAFAGLLRCVETLGIGLAAPDLG